MQTHYKLPLDDEFDKDITDWIDSFPRNKKGEMVRHAIRYYMEMEGKNLAFPHNEVSKATAVRREVVSNVTPVVPDENKEDTIAKRRENREKKKPNLSGLLNIK